MKKTSLVALCCLFCVNAHALDYSTQKWDFQLDVDGMAGFLETKDDKPLGIIDWDVKASAIYHLNSTQRIGAVYSIDADCVEDDEYIHDAFVLFQDRNIGRAEFGLTHSIARKMGLGLPDVGYLRINNKSILYRKLNLKEVLISDTTATTGHESLRLNLATISTNYGQYGLSIAGGGDDFNFALDTAAKFKQPLGKLKAAYSIALSYMDKPHGYEENSYTPPVYADWRSQAALGLNLQYNSFIFGISTRLIYDENPIGQTSDGLVAGTGLSYDFLQSSVSVNYLFSDTNLWAHHDKITGEEISGDYTNTVITSFRHKYSEHTSLFMSAGIADTIPFFAVGIKTGF
jgi:hypothetical protein